MDSPICSIKHQTTTDNKNSEQAKSNGQNVEEIETYVIPDSPVKENDTELFDQDLDEEENIYQSMNTELDKQIAEDMEAIRNYISKTDEDSLSKRIEFFSKMDNSHINKCIEKTVTNHILYQHTVLGTIKWHECHLCEYKATEKDRLQEHILAKHSGASQEEMFVCPHCSFMSKVKVELTKHLWMVHPENKEQDCQCEKCHLFFKRHFDLLRHMKNKHDLVAFPCEKCDFISVEETGLRQHILSEHFKLNVSWYKCAQCSYRTAKKIQLDRHIMYKHTLF